MRVLVIENYVGTPPGLVGQALAKRGVEVDLRAAWQGAPLPEAADSHAGLVVLGGDQTALDDAECPWLPQAVRLTQVFGAADKPVLGICLGAQLVARGAGGENILGNPIEFGWHPVRPTAEGRSDPVMSALGEGSPIFHWHTDTFTLPPAATHLAESDMTALQAFRIGRATYGIQFHFEADRGLVERWNVDFAEQIAAHTPDWPERHAGEAARHGGKADATGEALASAWAELLR